MERRIVNEEKLGSSLKKFLAHNISILKYLKRQNNSGLFPPYHDRAVTFMSALETIPTYLPQAKAYFGGISAAWSSLGVR